MGCASFANRCSLSGKVCCISVGGIDKRTDFHVHESLLRSRSKFFDAALNKCWQEGKAGRLELPEDEPEIFEIYQNFLYTRTLPIKEANRELKLRDDENHPEYFALALFYVFGEKVQDVNFKNAAIIGILKRMQEPVRNNQCWYPVTKVVDIIYTGTMPGSPARKLMVDVHVNRGAAHWITANPEENNKEFLVDLARLTLERASLKIQRVGVWNPIWATYLEADGQ